MTEAAAAIRNAVHCRDCAALISPTASTCPQCGGRQIPGNSYYGTPVAGTKSRVAAILLAFFLGGFGVHKFYLGRVAAGVLYLIFFWTLIPAIIAFVEMIIYITMSDEAFAHKYG
jgi:TM2 domain-containing membrane protein YozV/ribosomal protein L40E